MLLLTFILQYGLFFLLDLKAKEILNPSIKYDKPYVLNSSININSADNFSLSYNNRYLAFTENHLLKIIDLMENRNVFSSDNLDKGTKILNYKWLPDRNSLVFFCMKNTLKDNRLVQLYSLQLESGKYKIKLDREFKNFPSTFNISKIEISTYTNNLYLLVDINKNKKLMKIDIMKNINWLDYPQEKITEAVASNKFGTLYIQSIKGSIKQITALTGTIRKLISTDPDTVVLGCRDNKLYLGNIIGNKLIRVYKYIDNSKLANKSQKLSLTQIWEGEILFKNPEITIGLENEIIIKNGNSIDIIFNNGVSKHITTEGSITIIPPNGKLYLELVCQKNQTIYFWRSL